MEHGISFKWAALLLLGMQIVVDFDDRVFSIQNHVIC